MLKTISLLLAVSVVSAHAGGSSSEEFYYGGYYSADLLDQSLNSCMARLLSQSVDIIVDINNATAVVNSKKGKANCNPANKAVASLIDAIGQSIPQANYYSVIYNGAGSSQTRHFLSMATIGSLPPTTTTTLLPVVMMSGNRYRQPVNRPAQRCWPVASTLGILTGTYLEARSQGPIQVPTSKPAGATPTVFSVIITDGSQQTPVSSYPSPDQSLVVDIGGNFANNNKSYRSRNVLIPPANSWSTGSFVRTIRYQICQAIGGITA